MPKASTGNNLLALRRLGQSPWLDFISREFLASGELKRLVEQDGVTGVTSNPTIFEKSIASSSAYDTVIRRMAKEGKSAEEIYDVLTVADVGEAADLLDPVYRRTRGADGYVSIEVSPHCAHDTASTLDCARRIFASLGRKNILIKVPATEEGASAIEELLVAGINVNATLIISLAHYERAAQAYFRALGRRQRQGLSLRQVISFGSVFVSRIDTSVDKMLDKLAGAEKNGSKAVAIKNLRGKAAVANSSIIYHRFRERFCDFTALTGARVQRVVWASTSTKDPSYNDIKYVTELIGRKTVNTIPLATLKAFQDHGVARTALGKGVEEATSVIKGLKSFGVDIDAVCQQIQDEGVKAFADSYDTLIAAIEKKRLAFR